MINKKPRSTKDEKQYARTQANKIRRIEKAVRKHPKMANNISMMKRLDILKGGKNL